MFTKQDIIKSGILIWIVASVVYIGWDTWRDYQIRGVQRAYQTGANDSIKQLLDKSKAAQCKEAVPVTLGEEKMEFIDIACIQPAPTAQDASAQPQATIPKK